jgi:hypothetical protein
MLTNKEISSKIHDALIEKFKGAKADYSCYEVAAALRGIVVDAIKDSGYNPDDFTVMTSRDSHWIADVHYRKNAIVMEVRCKRQVADTKRWRKDYVYKDFEVDVYGCDYEDGFWGLLKNLDEQIDKRAAADREMDRRAAEVLKGLMETYGISGYQAKDICKRAVDRYYSLING